MTLQEWLTDARLHDIERLTTGGDQSRKLALEWHPPSEAGEQDAPVFVLSTPVETLAARTWGLQENNDVPHWTPVPNRDLAGLDGDRRVHALLRHDHLFLASQNPGALVPTSPAGNPPDSSMPALWSLRTSGKHLASLLKALDSIRLDHIEHPTLKRRRQVWEQLGHPLMPDPELEEASDSFFRINSRQMKRTLEARRDAWVALFSLLGPIEAQAVEREGRTHVEITLSIQP